MSNTCGHCEKPTELKICWDCAKLAFKLLVGGSADQPGIAWLYDRLTESAYGEAKLQQPGPRGKSSEIAAPKLNIKASNLRKVIHIALAGWMREVSGSSEVPDEMLPRGYVARRTLGILGKQERIPAGYVPPAPHIARYLASDLTALMNASCAAGMIRTLQRYTRLSVEVIDRRSDEYFGPCPAVIDGEACGEDLRGERGAQAVTCYRCHTEHDVEGVRAAALESVDMMPRSAADMLRLMRWLGRKTPPRSTFYALMGRVSPRMYQRKDGRITLTGEPGATALYAYGDVVAALERNEKKAS